MGSHHDLFEYIIPHKISVMQGSISTHLVNKPVEIILCHYLSELL